ncbi:hypothetical protein MMC25_000722 [Agyrium rufum]|nr:hypothetical protein [Agyrium rufum]
MESPLILTSLLVLSFSLVSWFLLDYFCKPKQSPHEPPLVASRIPYVGHILGLLWHSLTYYQLTSARCKLPIYTLNMLNGKVYVVTSPDLVTAVNRNSKTLALNPFIAQLGMRITGHDEATSQVVQHNLNGEDGRGYVIDVHDAIVSSLAPGPHLESMVEPMLNEADKCVSDHEGATEVDLFAWTRKMVTMCSTTAVYGPSNPFHLDPDYCNQFWNFDNDLNKLMINVFPNIIAPKGARARSILGAAFQNYFENFDPDRTQSAAMIKARYHSNTKYGLSTWNQGRLEVGTLLGVLANTIPSAFYMLNRIYSDPALLQNIRDELESSSVSTSESSRTLHVLRLRENCPLLLSTWQEVLRVHARGASSRFVREDTLLDNRYLLKKNMVVQMPMTVIHSDPASWGNDAHVFQARRFLKQGDALKGTRAGGPAYRPFGGGASMCPGRHFVALEVTTLVAYLVLRFDMEPSSGKWFVPAQRQESLATNVFPPAKDIKVKLSKRQGYEDVQWKFEVN